MKKNNSPFKVFLIAMLLFTVVAVAITIGIVPAKASTSDPEIEAHISGPVYNPGIPSVSTGSGAGYGGKALKSKSLSVRININPAAANNSQDIRPPSTKDVKYSPESIRQAAAVLLRAEIKDSDTGNSNIAAAEYFIGKAGENGKGMAMNASDGRFNSPDEAVSATVVVSPGQTIYVHGKDAAGNWGQFKSVTVKISDD